MHLVEVAMEHIRRGRTVLEPASDIIDPNRVCSGSRIRGCDAVEIDFDDVVRISHESDMMPRVRGNRRYAGVQRRAINMEKELIAVLDSKLGIGPARRPGRVVEMLG